ncbi:MAG: response regulator [Chryseolinea sp.]
MKKILLVEDTLEALQTLKDFLQIEGYEVITATNGEEALTKFYLYTPDLVITDLRMPKMDGFELLQKIKSNESLKSIPVIVFSANATADHEKRSKALGAAAFLSKPTSIDKLLEQIELNIGNRF